jgi:hypothetical protein
MDVFPGVDTSDLLIVPTCQRADLDLVQTGEKVDDEKDRLLERVSAGLMLVMCARALVDKCSNVALIMHSCCCMPVLLACMQQAGAPPHSWAARLP